MFFTDPELFDQQFRSHFKTGGWDESRASVEAFYATLQDIDKDDKDTALDTIVSWLKYGATKNVQKALLNVDKFSISHWEEETVSLGARLLVHSHDTSLITLVDDSVFNTDTVAFDLLNMKRVDLLLSVLASPLKFDWLDWADQGHQPYLQAFFKQAYETGQWDDFYQVLRTRFSYRWTASLLGGHPNQVHQLLDDPDFQKWSASVPQFFAQACFEWVPTYHAYFHMKNRNLFDVFGVNPQLLAAHTFANLLWDPPPETTSNYKPHYTKAQHLIDDMPAGVERAQFFEYFAELVKKQVTIISKNIGSNSFFSADELDNQYFRDHFLDFFERYSWDTATAQHILAASSWFFNIDAFKNTAPLQAAVLQLHVEQTCDTLTASKTRKM